MVDLAIAESNPIRVVIVDDAEDLRTLIAMKLAREGIEVVGEAGDGEEGLLVLKETEPDAALIDLAMPVMDGLQMIPQIVETYPKMKIVVLSGFEADLGRKAIALGAHAFLSKSDDLDLVPTILKGLCGLRV